MQSFIARHGLIAIFIGAIFEGDVTAILAGVAAHLGVSRFQLVVAVCAAGAVISDTACYAMGRARAGAIRQTRLYARVGGAVERLADRLGPGEIMFARFIYGTRVASMLFWGMRGLPLLRFLALDALGCILWAGALASLGFAVSGSAEILIGRVRRFERWLLAALVVAALASLVVHGIFRRRRERMLPPFTPASAEERAPSDLP